MGNTPASVPDKTIYPSFVPTSMQSTGFKSWSGDYRYCFYTIPPSAMAYTPPLTTANLRSFVIKDNICSGTVSMEGRTFSLTATMIGYGVRTYSNLGSEFYYGF